MAQMALDSYASNYAATASTKSLAAEFDRADSITKDNFRAYAYRSKKISWTVIAFRGTDNSEDKVLADGAGIGLALGPLAMHSAVALIFSQQWQKKSKDFWLTGHSLGGAFVQLVGAKLRVPGVTFNSPGVLNLLNETSGRMVRAPIGFLGGALIDLSLYQMPSVLNAAAAANDDSAFPPIANYRTAGDLVSRIGVPVGAPMQLVPTTSIGGPVAAHSMQGIVDAIALRK